MAVGRGRSNCLKVDRLFLMIDDTARSRCIDVPGPIEKRCGAISRLDATVSDLSAGPWTDLRRP